MIEIIRLTESMAFTFVSSIVYSVETFLK